MKPREIRDLSDAQIVERMEELREEEFRLRFQGAMMHLENPNLPRQVRQDIARLKTILKERERAREHGKELAHDPGMDLD